MISDFRDEYRRYRTLGEKAIAQVTPDQLNRVPGPDANSIAMLVRHVGGNLASRFTNFLTEDGEKPWRDRDEEFATRDYAPTEVRLWWERGFDILEKEIGALTEADLDRMVKIRGQSLTVSQALCRSLAHVAMHVGQIVMLAKLAAGDKWQTLSIPKGKSDEYNRNPTLEKPPT
jgi:hypothetical protein